MVATVVSLTSASSTVHYFRREGHGLGKPVNDNGEDYYARSDDEHRKASRWRGSGAAALGLSGHVEPGEFRRVLQGYVPGTDIRLGRRRDGEHEHRPGVDITLSAPKSVSLEALLGGPGSARAMRAHDAAVRATLDFIETRLLRTRRWSREERRSVQVNAPLLVAATFRHITERPHMDARLPVPRPCGQPARDGVPATGYYVPLSFHSYETRPPWTAKTVAAKTIVSPERRKRPCRGRRSCSISKWRSGRRNACGPGVTGPPDRVPRITTGSGRWHRRSSPISNSAACASYANRQLPDTARRIPGVADSEPRTRNPRSAFANASRKVFPCIRQPV